MRLLPLFVFTWLTQMSFAADILAEYQWAGTPGSQVGSIVREDNDSFLRVKNTNSTALRVQLLKIEKPEISAQQYALRGDVRYEQVQGDGFLEMWNIFPPAKAGGAEGQYFSRTLSASGEMGKITGNSEWRAFSLPFNMTGSSTYPSRLEVNLMLPGSGQVDLRGVKLVQFSGGFPVTGGQAWWSEKQAGILGGIGGTVLGCLGTLLGTLAARKKAQSFVIGTSKALVVLGTALAIVFVVALIQRQPFWVWYLPGLVALLILTIIPAQLRRFRHSYADAEMRRMVAADAVN